MTGSGLMVATERWWKFGGGGCEGHHVVAELEWRAGRGRVGEREKLRHGGGDGWSSMGRERETK